MTFIDDIQHKDTLLVNSWLAMQMKLPINLID